MKIEATLPHPLAMIPWWAWVELGDKSSIIQRCTEAFWLLDHALHGAVRLPKVRLRPSAKQRFQRSAEGWRFTIASR